MKKGIFTLLTIAILNAMAINAAVWRVNNISTVDARFTGIPDAISSELVMEGDTLHVEPSPVSYGSVTLNKRLTIIGNGYFLGENEETQAITSNSSIAVFTFAGGSDGSVIMGCTFTGIVINQNVSDIAIRRNLISGRITMNDNNNDIVILNNYIKTYTSLSALISISANSANLLVSGNFIENTYALGGNWAINMGSTSSAIFENNVIYNGVNIHNSVFNNNILRGGTFNSTNSNVSNNIGNADQFGTENGNQQNVTMADVFKGEGSTDGMWQLKEASPAIGAGVGGVDCGMFDGSYPYKLSGIPEIPAIFKYQHVYNTEIQELEVTFSVKSNN